MTPSACFLPGFPVEVFWFEIFRLEALSWKPKNETESPISSRDETKKNIAPSLESLRSSSSRVTLSVGGHETFRRFGPSELTQPSS